MEFIDVTHVDLCFHPIRSVHYFDRVRTALHPWQVECWMTCFNLHTMEELELAWTNHLDLPIDR